MKIRNTEKEASENPMGTLLQLAGTPSGGIEAMEARGQRELVESSALPTDCRRGAREAFIAAGGEFLAEIEGDPLFTDARLPAGWKREASDHSMWSHLVDESGRQRFAIFYKAAFYDRSAHMSAYCRLKASFIDSNGALAYTVPFGEEVPPMRGVVLDGDRIIWTGPKEKVIEGQPKHEVPDAAERRANAWLEKHYPNWRDPAAYWGEEISMEPPPND